MTNTAQDNTLIDSIANSVGRTIMSQNSTAPPPFAPFAPMFQSQPIPYVNPAFAQQYNPSAQQFPQQFYGQQFSGPQGFINNGGKQFSFNNGRKKDLKCFICNGQHLASDCKQHQDLKDKVISLEKQEL